MIRFAPHLKAGDPAPDFALPDALGAIHRLADFKGKSLVLFFYPADFTPGCTAEACAFRDRYPEFQACQAEIVGVSGDPAPRHAAFAAEHRLPYLLLSDPGAKARRAYGVPHLFGRLSGRCSFVVSPQGLITQAFNSRSRHLDHVSLSLGKLKA